MGIGNYVDIFVDEQARICSLPLMGIGNVLMSGFVLPFLRLSLPLMGIGNDRTEAREKAYPNHSLPLMGIGNSHTAGRGGSVKASLPLMGIGNVFLIQQLGILLQLITPHGDWKQSAFQP